MKHRFLLGLIVGVVLTVLLIVGGAYIYFAGGHAPVATDSKPMPFEKTLARMALHARIEKEMPKSAPIEATEPNLMAGAELYQQHCAVCHGLPGGVEDRHRGGDVSASTAIVPGQRRDRR